MGQDVDAFPWSLNIISHKKGYVGYRSKLCLSTKSVTKVPICTLRNVLFVYLR